MDINDILSSLTPDDIEELKATAEAVFGQSGGSADKQKQAENSNPFSSFDPKMIGKITKIMGAMNNESGRRCKLIEAFEGWNPRRLTRSSLTRKTLPELCHLLQNRQLNDPFLKGIFEYIKIHPIAGELNLEITEQ